MKQVSEISADLFALGRAASEVTRRAHGGRGWFAGWRHLRPDGTWQGPASAVFSSVEERDVASVGGMAAACALGANVFVGTSLSKVVQASSQGMRGILRLSVSARESPEEQVGRLQELQAQMTVRGAVDGVLPTPDEDALGLATLILVARCRLLLPLAQHVLVDLVRLGSKLGQICLAFGADELLGPVVNDRPLRLGENAGSHEITRAEAAQLLRGAGLRPFERVGHGQPQEFVP